MKKYKRGKRAGRRKQRKIKVIQNIFPIPPVVQNRKSDKGNLVMIDTEREFIEQSDSLKILYLNAQSLRNKATLLNDMIHELNIDIAFFTESWLKSSGDEVIIQNLTPEGFKAVSFHRESGNGGGICIVHRESMTIDLKRIRTFHSFECCECNLTIKKHTFICIYRPPPNKKNKLTTKGFIAEFHDLLDSFIKKCR